jgi:hypothetical protein
VGIGTSSPHRVRLGLGAAALAVAGALPADALASGDYGCDARWSLNRRQYDACNNVPFLSPSNDSRVNLVLLLADRGVLGFRADQTASYQSDYGIVPFGLDALQEWEVSPQPGADSPPPDQEPPTRMAFADGDANRCRTNGEDAANAFVAQLTASTDVPEVERTELERSRRALVAVACTSDLVALANALPRNIQSARGREFQAYVDGVAAFYAGAFDGARRLFESLHASEQPWLRETAQYMVGRSEMNRAQLSAFGLSSYPSTERVDRPALDASEAAFERYLGDHPSGRYAASAKGLLRRVYWLMGDRRRLAREYGFFLATPSSPLRNVAWPDLAHEIDVKLLGAGPEGVDEPLFVAVMDLMAMRDSGPPGPTLYARLEPQRPIFATAPRLYEYVTSAFAWYVDRDADRTLQSLPTTVPEAPLDTVAFSQQTLRGFALEAKGRWAAARTLWRTLVPRAVQPLQREQVELAYAMNCERSGRLADVFAKDSPVTRPEIRRILLKHVAGPTLLRHQIATSTVSGERDTALFTLLWKELTGGRYRDFLADLARLPKDAEPPEPDPEGSYHGVSPAVFAWRGGTMESGYTCPTLRDTATSLTKNPRNPRGLNCVAEFALRNELDGFPLGFDPLADDLGGTTSQFPWKPYSRLDAYRRVIDDASASRDDRAYALYRALWCFASSGFNHCGGKDASPSERKQWFRTLKTRYAATTWGKQLEVYW